MFLTPKLGREIPWDLHPVWLIFALSVFRRPIWLCRHAGGGAGGGHDGRCGAVFDRSNIKPGYAVPRLEPLEDAQRCVSN